jgi:hypothetical protein
LWAASAAARKRTSAEKPKATTSLAHDDDDGNFSSADEKPPAKIPRHHAKRCCRCSKFNSRRVLINPADCRCICSDSHRDIEVRVCPLSTRTCQNHTSCKGHFPPHEPTHWLIVGFAFAPRETRYILYRGYGCILLVRSLLILTAHGHS